MICEQVVQQIQVRQADLRVFFDDTAPEFNGLRVIGDVPIPGRMAFRPIQDPLAVLYPGGSPDRVFGVSGRFPGAGIHAVPVQVGDEACCALPVLFVVKLRLQKILVFPEEILREFICNIQAVFDAIQALLARQVEKLVNADPENLRQKRKRRYVGHGHRVFPLGHRLGADPQLFRQLLLRQTRFEAELLDLLSQFHHHDLLDVFFDCKLIIRNSSRQFHNTAFKSSRLLGELTKSAGTLPEEVSPALFCFISPPRR